MWLKQVLNGSGYLTQVPLITWVLQRSSFLHWSHRRYLTFSLVMIHKWRFKGTFENILYAPSLSTNLLSIYQITHYGNGKKVEFTPNLVIVKELENDALVAMGQTNHNSQLYSFSHLMPQSPSMALLTHSNLESNLDAMSSLVTSSTAIFNS